MHQSPISIVFRYDAPVAESQLLEPVRQTVLIDSSGQAVLSQPVPADGVGMVVPSLFEGRVGTVTVSKGEGQVIEYLDRREWFQYLDALNSLGQLDLVFQAMAKEGLLLSEALALACGRALRFVTPTGSSCTVIAPGEDYGAPDVVLVSDLQPLPEDVFEQMDVDLLSEYGNWRLSGKLDVGGFPGEVDSDDFKMLLRDVGSDVFVRDVPLATALEDAEHRLRTAAVPMAPRG